ncbi:MAG TPA: glycosyltransferase family 1 protein [Burkholderiaceae bacterium]
MRVLHCPDGIGGQPQQLARSERVLGLDSRAITFLPHPFGYPTDEVMLPNRGSQLALEAARWRLLWRAVRDFDMIHFNFGQTIMPPAPGSHPSHSAPVRVAYNLYCGLFHLRDLPLLKWLGKGIAMTYQGDDARQGDFCREQFSITHVNAVEPHYYTPETDARKRADIARVARHADCIYALNPDLLHVLPGRAQFLPYASVDLSDWQVMPAQHEPRRPLTVLHAPSHRGVKGTTHVLEAIERLRTEGVPVELLLIEKMSHSEARRAYERADLLVDQLLVGWYGGLAVELMALGKPVVCYLREGDLGRLPLDMRADLPVIQATPETIYAVLKEWTTTRRGDLARLGRCGRAYVERWHDPLKIAARLKADYECALANRSRTASRIAGMVSSVARASAPTRTG